MKPRKFGFSPISIVIVMAMVMMIWSVYATSSADVDGMSYSSVMRYFETLQVTAVQYNPNTSTLTLSLKEGDTPLPEVDEETESITSQSLLSSMFSSETTVTEPENGGVMVLEYTMPYVGFFLNNIEEYQELYNVENPDAPMDFDMDAIEASFPWEMLIYVVLIGATIFVFFIMLRGGGAGGGMMNVGRAKVKDESEKNVKTTFADVAGEEEEKEELQEVVEFLKQPERLTA
ncbi:MAG: ATP-dependent zinc metalloprotease FtsH, partial [Faecalibacterium sp.]